MGLLICPWKNNQNSKTDPTTRLSQLPLSSQNMISRWFENQPRFQANKSQRRENNMAEQSPLSQLPTPKGTFLLDERLCQAHRRMVESKDFQASVKAALEHYHQMMIATQGVEMSDTGYVQDSHVRFMKMQGASNFVDVLITMDLRPPPRANRDDKIESLT